MILRAATADDSSRILAWNEADVHFLAPMDPARLAYLSARASVEIVESCGQPAGFVITFVEGSDYDSENYLWFSERESTFHYVDRIVLDPAFRGNGLGRRVYATLVDRFPDRPLLAEVSVEPPNTASLAFHDSVGFSEIGRRGDRSNGVVLLRRPPQGVIAG